MVVSMSSRRARRRSQATSLPLLLVLSFSCIVAVAWSTTRFLVDGATSSSLNPLSIGIRSAIARRQFGLGAQHSGSSNLPLSNNNIALVSSRSSHQHRRHPVVGRRIGNANNNNNNHREDQLPSENENDDDEQQFFELTNKVHRGGGASSARSSITNILTATAPPTDRRLHFWEAMICGAVSRAAAQTIMHPANTMKTILQSSRKVPGQDAPLSVLSFTQWKHARQLTRGVGAQLVLSIPHGAVNFAVLELVRRRLNGLVSRSRHADVINRNFGPGMDFLSSALSTICCSVVSTPQMMICDNIMAGTYPNLLAATRNLMKDRGVAGFYTGWWPGLAGKIPSYVSFSNACALLFLFPLHTRSKCHHFMLIFTLRPIRLSKI